MVQRLGVHSPSVWACSGLSGLFGAEALWSRDVQGLGYRICASLGYGVVCASLGYGVVWM